MNARTKERITELSELLKCHFDFVEMNMQYGWLTVNLEKLYTQENATNKLILALTVINSIPEYKSGFEPTHKLGYYDSVEDRGLLFYGDFKK